MVKKNIVFVDATYPEPYDSGSIGKQALGGTEASVIRTAEILSKQHHNVWVLQKSRTSSLQESETLTFAPLSDIKTLNPDAIVVLRKYPLALQLGRNYPNARLLLWIHTYKNHEFVLKRAGLAKHRVSIICNSKTHQVATEQKLNKGLLGHLASLFYKKIPVHYCYNPIPEPSSAIINDAEPRDLNKLVFFSSPNKGLAQVLACFQIINQSLPELKLFIANPGYKTETNQMPANAITLGSLPHAEMMRHVREALCVFYPQDSFAETFGLIYAEANAYGTPVLAHDIGSAREILDDNNPLIDVNDMQQVLKLIKQWRQQQPAIQYCSSFNSAEIFKQWTAVLFNPALIS